MFNYVKNVVKNKLRGELDEDENKKLDSTKHAGNNVKRKPDHTVVNLDKITSPTKNSNLASPERTISEYCNRENGQNMIKSIRTPDKKDKNSSTADGTSPNTPPAHNNRPILRPTKFFSPENKSKLSELHETERKEFEANRWKDYTITTNKSGPYQIVNHPALDSPKIMGCGQNLSRPPNFIQQPQLVRPNTPSLPPKDDYPRILSMKEFADVTGVRTKIEKRVRMNCVRDNNLNLPLERGEVPSQSDASIETKSLQDICQEESTELFNRYKDHYAHYVKRCKQYGRKPVEMTEAIGNVENMAKELGCSQEKFMQQEARVGSPKPLPTTMSPPPANNPLPQPMPPPPPPPLPNHLHTMMPGVGPPPQLFGPNGMRFPFPPPPRGFLPPPMTPFSHPLIFKPPVRVTNRIPRPITPHKSPLASNKDNKQQQTISQQHLPAPPTTTTGQRTVARLNCSPESSKIEIKSHIDSNLTRKIKCSDIAEEVKDQNRGKFQNKNGSRQPCTLKPNRQTSHVNRERKTLDRTPVNKPLTSETLDKEEEIQKCWEVLAAELWEVLEKEEQMVKSENLLFSPPQSKPEQAKPETVDPILEVDDEIQIRSLPKRNIFVQALIPSLDLIKPLTEFCPSQYTDKVIKDEWDKNNQEYLKSWNEFLQLNIETMEEPTDQQTEIKTTALEVDDSKAKVETAVLKQEEEVDDGCFSGDRNKQNENAIEKCGNEESIEKQTYAADSNADMFRLLAEMEGKMTDINVQEVVEEKECFASHHDHHGDKEESVLEKLKREIAETQQLMSSFSSFNTFYRGPNSTVWLQDVVEFTENLNLTPPHLEPSPKNEENATDEMEHVLHREVISPDDCVDVIAKEELHLDTFQWPKLQGSTHAAIAEIQQKKISSTPDGKEPIHRASSEKEATLPGLEYIKDTKKKEPQLISGTLRYSSIVQQDEKRKKPVLKDGPMILHVSTSSSPKDRDDEKSNKIAKELCKPAGGKKLSTKCDRKKGKEKDTIKEPSKTLKWEDLLEKLSTLKNKEDYDACRKQLMSLYAVTHGEFPLLAITGDGVGSGGEKFEGNTNLVKWVKNINTPKKVLFCSIDVRRCLKNHHFPQLNTAVRSERTVVQNLLKKGCKALNERFKGQISPLSFNDEHLQELLKKGIIDHKDQSTDTSCASVYKGQGGRTIILLNFIEHVRVIVSSRKGDMKKLFSDALFILTTVEENLKHNSFLRDDKLGYLNPKLIGNAFSCSVEVIFECLEKSECVKKYLTDNGFEIGFITYNKKLKLNVYRLDSKIQTGISEVETLKNLHSLISTLDEVDKRMELGQFYEDLLETPLLS